MKNTEELLLVKFELDLSYGGIDGLFVATKEEYEKLIGLEIYFGEVGGKHSEVEAIIDRDCIDILSTNQELINLLVVEAQSTSIIGYNLCAYLK